MNDDDRAEQRGFQPYPGLPDAEDDAARTRARQRWTVVVEGETFTITPDDGGWNYDWVSGPNKGYGFSSSRGFTVGDPSAPPVERTEEQHEQSIRNFLSMINPETGYIDD